MVCLPYTHLSFSLTLATDVISGRNLDIVTANTEAKSSGSTSKASLTGTSLTSSRVNPNARSMKDTLTQATSTGEGNMSSTFPKEPTPIASDKTPTVSAISNKVSASIQTISTNEASTQTTPPKSTSAQAASPYSEGEPLD